MKPGIPIALLVCIIILSACEAIQNSLTFTASPSRTIIITDSDSTGYFMRLSDIERDKFIILALLKEVNLEWFQNLTQDDLTRVAFGVGKIEDGKFQCTLKVPNLSNWVGSGSYYVAFVMADGAMSKVALGYLSKFPLFFWPEVSVIHLNNLNFTGSVEMEIDISTLPGVPFK